MTRIRRISVHVDEAEQGKFYWVLMEVDGASSTWKRLKVGTEPFDLWLDALTEGVCALENYADDERIGPRTSSDE